MLHKEGLANLWALGGSRVGLLAPSVVAHGTIVLLVPPLVKVLESREGVVVDVVGPPPSELVE